MKSESLILAILIGEQQVDGSRQLRKYDFGTFGELFSGHLSDQSQEKVKAADL